MRPNSTNNLHFKKTKPFGEIAKGLVCPEWLTHIPLPGRGEGKSPKPSPCPLPVREREKT